MNKSPIFSIVIPTYNRAAFIKNTVESVLSQVFQDFEVIVVDDGSSDNTEEVVKTISNNKLRYFKKENQERGAARNFGAAMANGQYVNFLDSDDLLYNNHLSVAHNFVRLNEGVEIFHLGYEIKYDNDEIRSIAPIQNVNQQILSGNILSCNGVFVRKDVILSNRFNEDRVLSSLEDWELWIRMSARYPFRSSNEVTSAIIQHDDRSVMTSDGNKIKEKVKCFVLYVLQDEVSKKHFGKNLNEAVASAWTYASLHLAMTKAGRNDVVYYLLKGVYTWPSEIMKKRFLVILKKLFGF